MNRLLIAAILFLLLAPGLAYADNEGIRVDGVRTERGDFTVDLRVDNAAADGIEFFAEEGGKKERGTAEAAAEELWVLVDSSALCQAQKVDAYVNRLVRGLRKQAAADTRVTLVTYTSEATDVLLRHKKPSELTEAKVECEKRPLSASYDKPLAKLLSEEKATTRPLAVWVFTAGNVDLSRATAAALEARDASLAVVLYNPFLEKDIRPVWQAVKSRLGGLDASFSALASPEGVLRFPSARYAVDFPVDPSWAGKRATFKISAVAVGAKEAFARGEFVATPPIGGLAFFWRKYGRWILLGLGVFSVGYGVARIVRYYRARRCDRCHRRVSHRLGTCLFCEAANHAYLVGSFRRRHDGFGRDASRQTVLPLEGVETQIGSHRRSAVRLPPNGRPGRYVRLLREETNNGPRFRIAREVDGRYLDIRVNGSPLGRERCLADGDEIRVEETTMVFHYGGAAHAE